MGQGLLGGHSGVSVPHQDLPRLSCARGQVLGEAQFLLEQRRKKSL